MLKDVNIGLLGGLGNQLFQLSYALYLKNTTKCYVTLNPTSLKIPPLTKKISMHSLQIKNLIQYSFYNPINLPLTYSQVILSRLSRTFGLDLSNSFWLDNENVDLRDQRFSSYNRINLYGYFNNLHSYNNCFKFVSEQIKSELKDELSFNAGKLALHFRRGDAVYDRNRSIIESEYYEKLLLNISNNNKISEITIFTDNIDQAKRSLKIGSDNIVYDDVVGSTPLDILTRMASHEFVICANSTFSFWAGVLSNEKSQIYYPKLGAPVIFDDSFKKVFKNWSLI
jgi:hypothetical protein